MSHDQAGDRVDWEVSASYTVGESGIRLHSHVGTGFRAPSLYELYGASVFGTDLFEFGNEDLKPEESLGWDIGVELKAFEEKLRFDMTYFNNKFDKIIHFGDVEYENIDGGKSRGIEVEAAWRLTDDLTVAGSYTYTDTEDANGEKFFGVPEYEVGMHLNYIFLEKFDLDLAMMVKGDEELRLFDSMIYMSKRYTNDGYTTVDVALGYELNEHFNAWARIENLFDEKYTVGGYEAPGTSFFGGIKFTL